ncbi:hypothetical protein ACF09Y_22335 [Streptomyces massasporeus]|uniref:hypothetical protein n=1 Tax=Streptomyces massasporeus TaxID=67324 RepID=UPI003700BE22
MATQIVQAPTSADEVGTAQLPPAAEAAIRSLDLRLRFPAEIVAAVTVHETAAERAAQLAAKAAAGKDLAALDIRSWQFAEELMAGARATLANAGRLDLIEAAA